MKKIMILNPKFIEDELTSIGEKKYRAKQINQWIFKKNIFTFDEMTNISKELRNKLNDNYNLYLPKILLEQKSNDGTVKFLLETNDQNKIEMVLIPAEKKNTLCISSQVGCARNCQFCATARLGLKRNLTVNEIVGQVLLAQKYLEEKHLTNIVFMGMGEPLDNLENVINSLKILQDENGISFSPRRTTISTSGVVPKILELAKSDVKVKLAVSLNSAIDAKRDILMPINKKYHLTELKKSLITFRENTSYRITFEYVMIKNFNMTDEDVRALKKFAGDLSCKINLIPWNTVDNLNYISPSENDIDQFIQKLHSINAAITVRRSRGADIDAACGQLAGKNQ